jgi:hypothetical protein
MLIGIGFFRNGYGDKAHSPHPLSCSRTAKQKDSKASGRRNKSLPHCRAKNPPKQGMVRLPDHPQLLAPLLNDHPATTPNPSNQPPLRTDTKCNANLRAVLHAIFDAVFPGLQKQAIMPRSLPIFGRTASVYPEVRRGCCKPVAAIRLRPLRALPFHLSQ